MDARKIKELLLSREDASKWMSISNILLVLLIIFILISILVIGANNSVNNEVKEAITTYKSDYDVIYEKLNEEFKDDLKKWNATLSKDDLSIIFHSYEFASGSTKLNKELRSVLDDFFPRYIKVCYGLADKVDEVRIEGHTDSEGSDDINKSYLANLSLSQRRTVSLLGYGFSIMKGDESLLTWMRKTITATGFSFSRPVLDSNGNEDMQASRRVEFRILPKVEVQLEKIDNIINDKL